MRLVLREMLDDRYYMRQGSSQGRWLLTHWLIAINIAVFALQEINGFYFRFPLDELVLSADKLQKGHVWQLITFQFLHAGFTHMLFNVVGIYCFGRMIEERLGRAGLLKVYLISGIAGGLLQSALSAVWSQHFGSVVGASAGVCGLIAAVAVLDPASSILIWFVLPVKAKHVLVFIAAVSIFYIFVPSGGGARVAHGAHLGGILGGLAYMRWGPTWEDFIRTRRMGRARLRPRQLMRVRASKVAPWQRDRDGEEIPAEEFISREVDPILDKISEHGIQSLTARERQILEAARARMERR